MKHFILFLAYLVFIFAFSLFVHPMATQAQVSQDVSDHTKATASDQENLSKFSFESADSFSAAWGNAIMGAKDGNDVIINGAFPSSVNLMAQLITEPPIQSSEYFADVLHNFGVAQPAYAQGTGFSALTPVLQLWKAFRNIAYFLFIIIFVVVGFMIMFRAQINPQTVVTVQAALPKMVVTLILITFSYAIAGFVIDLIYLLFFVMTSVLQTFGILVDPGGAAEARNAFFGFSIVRIGFKYLISPWEAAGSGSTAAGNLFSAALGIPRGLQGIASTVFYLIIAVAIIVAVFRTLFALLMAWVSIILSVIFSPIQLLLNALPQFNTFGGWIRGLVANALIFPAVGLMLIIGIALSSTDDRMGVNGLAVDPGGGTGTGWVPPMVTSTDSRTGTNQASTVIGIGIIMLLPEVAKLIKSVVGTEDKLGIGEMVSGGLRRGTGPMKIITVPASMVTSAAVGEAGRQGATGIFTKYSNWRATQTKAKLEPIVEERLNQQRVTHPGSIESSTLPNGNPPGVEKESVKE